MNINLGDIKNSLAKLERSARKIGIDIADFPLLEYGDPVHCMEIVKVVLFSVSEEVSQIMFKKKCTSSTHDKRIVLTFMDILRDVYKTSENLSAEQFLGKGLAEHKILIINKLIEYVLTFTKAQSSASNAPPTPPKSAGSSVASSPNNSFSSPIQLMPMSRHVQSPQSTFINPRTMQVMTTRKGGSSGLVSPSLLTKSPFSPNSSQARPHLSTSSEHVKTFDSENVKEMISSAVVAELESFKNYLMDSLMKEMDSSFAVFEGIINAKIDGVSERLDNLQLRQDALESVINGEM